MQRLVVWADGSTLNGSGWAVIVPTRKIIYRGNVTGATNQQAELSAVIQAVFKFGPNIHIITDSKYTIGCFTDWYHNWLKNGWRNAKKKPVENRQLIEIGLKLGANFCTYEHVKGHTGIKYNEMADWYAKGNQLKLEHSDWTLIQG